jgi:hypothetical protein
MWTYQAYVALQLAQDRVREADNDRLAAIARANRPARDRSVRRSTAVAFASISAVAASIARRLDRRVADDLSGASRAEHARRQSLTSAR